MIALTAISASPARAARSPTPTPGPSSSRPRTTTISNLTTAAEPAARADQRARQADQVAAGPGGLATQVSALFNQQAVLKEELAQLQVNGAAATSGLEFVTPAQAPTSPSSPKPVQDALLGLAAGLLLGLGAAFLRDSLDDTLSSKEAAERFGGAPVLATVPMVNSWRKRNQADGRLQCGPDLPGRRGVPVAADLTAVRPADRELRTLLVTSPAAGEGKTSTLVNLGAVFAQAGERVVLVSCDLRRPRLGQFFGIDEQSGLTTVLLGQQTLEQALQPVPGVRLPVGARRRAGPAEPDGTARRAEGQGDLRRRSGRTSTWCSSTARRCCRSPTP